MQYVIKHAVRGRVRIFLPAIRHAVEVADALSRWFTRQAGITSARVNPCCASLVFYYDAERPEIESRILARLRRLPPRKLMEAEQPGPAETKQSPTLASATASLALSLISGPLAGAASLPLLVYSAAPGFQRAYRVLNRERRLNVDFLDALAISLSVLQGNLFTASLIAWLVNLGDWIRDQTGSRSKSAIERLLDYRTRKAWVQRGARKVEVQVQRIKAGDIVIVYAGGMIPVDGVVIKGTATVDQQTITGESLPVEKRRFENVYAGTTLQAGQLYLRTKRVGAETTAAQIVHLVEGAPVGETRIQNYSEKFADRLVAPALGLSAGLYALSADAERLASMLIVDYGTGIRVAAPTSVLASIIHAARQGVLFKSGSHMEKLASVSTIVFDKTGTLTRGSPRIVGVLSYDERNFPPKKLTALAAAAELRLRHPVAQAFVAKAREDGLRIPHRDGSKFQVGLGVTANVSGYFVQIGSERFLRHNNVRTDRAQPDLSRLNHQGYSTLLLAVNGQLAGLALYMDQIRPEMPSVIRMLHNRGIDDLIMITGDNSTVAHIVAGQLGLDRFFSDTLPENKVEIVRQLQAKGRTVAMVGDGINDSPALSYADVGIAMKNGADVTREVANVVLMEENMCKLITAIDISRDAMGLIQQNYTIIAGLNTMALGLAIPSGIVSPGFTALLSNGSAIIAALNGIRPILRY